MSLSCSVAQLYPTIPNSMNCNMPGLPVVHHLPELALTHVHIVGDAVQPSQPLSSPSPPAFNLSESFPMSEFFVSGGQRIGTSDSASVLLMNTQGGFSLEFPGYTPLSKGLSRFFSSCGHTRVLPAQQMFKKHLLGARLDERLRTQVSNAGLVLEKVLIEGK